MGLFKALGSAFGGIAKGLGSIGKGGEGFMGKFGTGTGFLSGIGQGGAGFMGKFGTGQGQISGLLGKGMESVKQGWQDMPGSTLDKLNSIAGSLDGGFSAPTGQEMTVNPNQLSKEQKALVGTGTSSIKATQLNPIYNPFNVQGSQWGYNAPQAGMKGIHSMQGLLGKYMGGGGYRAQ